MTEAREHTPPDALAGFLRAEDAPSAAEAVRRHLLGGCLPCLLRARDALREQRTSEGSRLRIDLAEGVVSWARRVAERAERAVLLVDAERVVAETLASDLLSLPRADRRLAVRKAPEGLERFRLFGLAEYLTRQARDQAFGDGRRAEETAELALLVAQALDPGLYPSRAVTDIVAQAWATLGNARRVAGDLDAAERALTIARDQVGRSSGDPLLQADVWSLFASLRSDQRRIDETVCLLEEARSIYREEGHPRLEGKIVIKLATTNRQLGRFDRAVTLAEEAEALLDPALDRWLVSVALYVKVNALVGVGRPDEAAALFPRLRSLYLEESTERRQSVRIHWIGARIARALGETERAVEELETARRGFAEAGSPFQSALVTLELGTIRLEQRNLREVRRLARETLATFSTLRLHRHAVRALDLARGTLAR